MLVLMVVLFLLGYAAIAMEHQINVNKAASALVLCCFLWTIYIFIAPDIVANTPEFKNFLANEFGEEGYSNLAVFDYVTSVQIIEHVGDIAEIFGDRLPIAELAHKLGTIPYEVLTSISHRVQRVYFYE